MMSGALLQDAFGHHIWATLRLIEACRQLSEEQLSRPVHGTYGSILDTLRHLVAADTSYLHVIGGGEVPYEDHEGSDLDQLAEAMERNGRLWRQVLEGDLDPGTMLVRHRPDGSSSHAPLGIRLAQVVHHGTDHRSQVCTALTSLGLEPPEIDVWDYGSQDGRVYQTPAS